MKTKESKGFLQKVFDFNARLISKLDARIDNNWKKVFDHAGKACDAFKKLNVPKAAYEIVRGNMAGGPLTPEIFLAVSLGIANLTTQKLAKTAHRPLVVPPPKP